MSFFGIFSVKTDAKKTFCIQSIKEFFAFIRREIIGYVEAKDLLGSEKKEAVDEKVVEYVEGKFIGSNTVLNWLVRKIFIPVIPTITQAVYDLLREHVDGLTRN